MTEERRSICNGRRTVDPEEELQRWIGEEAVRQGRCPLCLSPVKDCGGVGVCTGPPVSTTRAVGILRGMVAG